MHRDSKWARELLALQHADGSWGFFHSLAMPTGAPPTTEQALRRLKRLGYTGQDACIQRAVRYMDDCLTGKKALPDRREKHHDWDIFTSLMLAAWIREFTPDNEAANTIARQWGELAAGACSGGSFSFGRCAEAYTRLFGKEPRGGRLTDLVNFYSVSLLNSCLDPAAEAVFLDHILNHGNGLYYLYHSRLSTLPQSFASLQASRYLGAIELLARYPAARKKLQFVGEWLESNRNERGNWDMGSAVQDKIYFPLSDNWRSPKAREADCTERIAALLHTLQT